MTESVRAGPNFSVISCLCLWTARWSSLVNLYTSRHKEQNKLKSAVEEVRKGRGENRKEDACKSTTKEKGVHKAMICLGKLSCGQETAYWAMTESTKACGIGGNGSHGQRDARRLTGEAEAAAWFTVSKRQFLLSARSLNTQSCLLRLWAAAALHLCFRSVNNKVDHWCVNCWRRSAATVVRVRDTSQTDNDLMMYFDSQRLAGTPYPERFTGELCTLH